MVRGDNDATRRHSKPNFFCIQTLFASDRLHCRRYDSIFSLFHLCTHQITLFQIYSLMFVQTTALLRCNLRHRSWRLMCKDFTILRQFPALRRLQRSATDHPPFACHMCLPVTPVSLSWHQGGLKHEKVRTAVSSSHLYFYIISKTISFPPLVLTRSGSKGSSFLISASKGTPSKQTYSVEWE